MIYLVSNTMLEEIKKWSRENRQLFDLLRSQSFQPTQEEIEQMEQKNIQDMVFRTQWYLALYGIEFTWNEVDFTKLYTLYIKWNWSEDNGDMKEWIWSDIDSILDERVKNNNNLKDFCMFVIWYES